MNKFNVTAVAELTRTVGQALITFADEVAEPDVITDAADPSEHPNLGPRQRQILQLPDLVTDQGLPTADIADAVGIEASNASAALQSLTRNGLVEPVPGRHPRSWRLARQYRPNADAFKQLASHVHSGEWTTYGDVSIAVTGSHKAARGVGRAAAKDPDFPHPHRVLQQDGHISANWRSDDGLGPQECRRRLEAEGIHFDDEDAADPRQRITWHELRQRDHGHRI